MNKPQYLAELNQLLIFMTRADREQTVDRCGALFDKAGPAGEEALLSRLGSPTRLAIRMSRTYEPGHAEDELLARLEAETVSGPEDGPEAEPKDEPAPPAPAFIEDDLPDFDLPDLPAIETPASEPSNPEDAAAEDTAPRFVPVPVSSEEQAPPSEGETPPAEDGDGGEDDGYEELWGKRPPSAPEDDSQHPDEDEQAYDEGAEEDFPEDEPAPVEYAVERVIPLWAGVPLFVLAVILLVIPVTCVGVLLIPVFLLPGLAVLLAAFLAAVGGLWCISIIADAAVLFGLALILLALGLLVLWCGLWLDVSMVTVYGRGVQGLSHLTLGRKVIVHAQ